MRRAKAALPSVERRRPGSYRVSYLCYRFANATSFLRRMYGLDMK